jgi:hypothetical protein
VRAVAGSPVGDGFFPVVSPEVATRNRKRRKVIHDRQRGRTPGCCLLFPLLLAWFSLLCAILVL